ncbi:MAG: hypothetical protein ACK5C0_08585 [Candidatus Kapaibacterium sp.]
MKTRAKRAKGSLSGIWDVIILIVSCIAAIENNPKNIAVIFHDIIVCAPLNNVKNNAYIPRQYVL